MFSCLSFNCVLLLLLQLLLTGSLEVAYIAEVGKNAYLPCKYNLPTSGTLVPLCWGKGPCPFSQCTNMVLSANERTVTYQKSSRYRLMGDFYKGNVSLTIENVTFADRGIYCCRIQFPGLGNDKKLNLELDIIKPTETQTLWILCDKNQTKMSTMGDELEDSGETIRTAIYIGVGVSAGLALALIFGVLILKWYSYKKKKSQNLSLVTLANFPPAGLENAGAGRIHSEENVYTIEENVYEIENSNEYYCFVSSRQPS
ncbi:hepatitis A virus cellular receptor 2 homolog [Acomys russatus]|uniref:hepatitis A virus cellular receptor 2 homolog n=1 Tax=Acomys russatus TaxID=60746 RepID=UPI0021E320D0|nr:hepatitis A virus cellular receptor 2 homolog [Acomys russatus]